MDIGHKVGEMACKLLAPGGVYIGLEDGIAHALEATRMHIASGLPNYEATFAFDQVLVRSDIVIPSGPGLKVIEVKSSTQVKEYHFWDCAIQFRVLQGTGYAVQEIQVAVIDSSFVYPGAGNYQGLLRTEDMTKAVLEMQPQVESWVRQCQNTLQGSMPSIEVGDHCSSPFDCPFLDFCMPADWPEYPLKCLPGISSQLRDTLKQEGFEDIRDIPQGRLPSPIHERVRRVTVSGKAELLTQAAKILDSLAYPRYFLDFETAQFAIPIWEGTRPYEQLPFQWSCHVQDAADQLRHLEFLDLSGQPPMRRFAESLLSACGESGPIIVYGSFERTVISSLIQRYPDLATDLESLSERIVDLLPIMRQNYYHPKMCGSWSLKAVQPCLVPDLSYASLGEVQEGSLAQEAYAEAISPDTAKQRKEELRKGLLAYCEMDTLAMVRIVKAVGEGVDR
jgi:hypothetical protein